MYSDSKGDIVTVVILLLALAVIVTGILVGQELRNQRAASVESPRQFVTSVTIPNGYKCFGEPSYTDAVYIVACEPFR